MQTPPYRIICDAKNGFQAQRRGWLFWRNIGRSRSLSSDAYVDIHNHEKSRRKEAEKRALRGRVIRYFSADEAASGAQKI